MGNPSLTPHADAVEKSLGAMFAAMDRQVNDPDTNKVAHNFTRSLLPETIRALAREMDLHRPPAEIIDGASVALANVIVSMLASIGGPNFNPGSEALHDLVERFMKALSAEVAVRSVYVPKESLLQHRYKPPTSGRA